jgi:hypothetical protein
MLASRYSNMSAAGAVRQHNLVRGRLRQYFDCYADPEWSLARAIWLKAYVERGKVWVALGVLAQAA